MLQQHKIRFTVFSFKNMHTHTHIYSHTLHFVNSINNNKNNNNNSSNKKKNQEKILAKSFWTWCSYYSLLIQTALTRSQPECIHLWYEPSPQKDGYTESARIIHYHRFHMSEGVRAFAIISGCMKKKKMFKRFNGYVIMWLSLIQLTDKIGRIFLNWWIPLKVRAFARAKGDFEIHIENCVMERGTKQRW